LHASSHKFAREEFLQPRGTVHQNFSICAKAQVDYRFLSFPFGIGRKSAVRAIRDRAGKFERSLLEMSGVPAGRTLPNGSPLPVASLRKRVREATREIESAIILEALEQNRWNRRRTAEALQISYRLLMYKMKNCNLRERSVDQQTVQS
jgi:DNA-binding NtrC family response regulator